MQNFSVHTVSEKNMDHVLNRPYFGIFSRNVHLKNATTLFTKQISIGHWLGLSNMAGHLRCIISSKITSVYIVNTEARDCNEKNDTAPKNLPIIKNLQFWYYGN